MASKYRKYERKEIKKKEMSPIWRGIGCLLFVIVPAISYFVMTLLYPVILRTGQMPPEVVNKVKWPEWVLKVPILSNIATSLSSVEGLWLKLIIFVVVLLLLATVSSLVYTMVQSVIGPPRYTEMDAPEVERGAKRYTR